MAQLRQYLALLLITLAAVAVEVQRLLVLAVLVGVGMQKLLVAPRL
jgi:hypothetical protein